MNDRSTVATTPEERLDRALERIDDLGRQVAHAQAESAQRQDLLAELRDALRLLDGRTRRHEAGQDAIRELRDETAQLRERLDEEASLRRDGGSALERAIEHERETHRTAAAGLAAMAARLDEVERQLGQKAADRRSAAERAGEQSRHDQDADERLAQLEARTAADRDAIRALSTEVSALASTVPSLRSGYDELSTRTRETQIDQRRSGDSIAALEAERERESELLDVIERQRAARHTLEERLAAIGDDLEAVRNTAAEAAQERAVLRQHVSGLRHQIEAATDAVEAHRLALLEHFGMQVRAVEESHRRQADELARASRQARDLLVRLTERSAASASEQPL